MATNKKNNDRDMQEMVNDQTETFYGKQTYKNKQGEVTHGYQFKNKEDLDWWKNADIQTYQESYDPKYTREALSPKAFQEMLPNFKNKPQLFEVSQNTRNMVYGHVTVSNRPKSLGIVVAFDDQKQRAEFTKQALKNGYENTWQALEPSDPKVTAAYSNKAILNAGAPLDRQTHEPIPDYKIDQERFKQLNINIKIACKQYEKLDPAKNSFLLIAQKNWRNPIAISLNNKMLANNIVQQEKESANITVKPVSNFNKLVISAAISKDRGIQPTQNLYEAKQLITNFKNITSTIDQAKDTVIIENGKMQGLNSEQFRQRKIDRGEKIAAIKPQPKKQKASVGMAL